MLKAARNSKFMSNGVTISPAVPTAGDNVTVTYDGLLAKNGAAHIYAQVGFGSQWDGKAFYKMNKTGTGFEATVPVGNGDTMNICFKDCADNWDNNSGKNYSFDITQ